MRVGLFFLMEKQIPRIRAEKDMRRLAVSSSVNSKDGLQSMHKTLVLEQGNVFVMEHNKIVAAEKGAMSRLKAMFKGGSNG